MTMQQWILELMARRNGLNKALEEASRGELQAKQFAQLKQLLQDAVARLGAVHAKAGTISCPAMSNVPEGTSLADLIRPGDWQAPDFTGSSISSKQIGTLMGGYGDTVEKLRRMFLKGMGNILSTQEGIAADFSVSQAAHAALQG